MIPNIRLSDEAHGFIDHSCEYFGVMHEAYCMGWHGFKLMKLFGNIIEEGDATNIREIWEGYDDSLDYVTDEMKKYPKGFKHLMITVPKRLQNQGYSFNYNHLSENQKGICEEITLRKLPRFLEEQGKDYPPELSPCKFNHQFFEF